MESGEHIRLHALIEGYVQGVGYRYFVVENAQALALTGWVRNLYDGRVEVVAEGDRQALGKLLTILHRGPHSSRVISVSPEWKAATGEFSGFKVRYSDYAA